MQSLDLATTRPAAVMRNSKLGKIFSPSHYSDHKLKIREQPGEPERPLVRRRAGGSVSGPPRLPGSCPPAWSGVRDVFVQNCF